jgi:signal transduction histidine kinase
VEVSLEAPEKLEACVDALAFQTVLQNLIDNAVRYGRRDGHVIVELELVSLPPASVMLSVSDDGPGIAEVERPRVFERFYRGQNVESTGAGLGLSIVKQATARMGGSIQLVTGPGGHGCRFEVWIPRVQTRMVGNPSFAICE